MFWLYGFVPWQFDVEPAAQTVSNGTEVASDLSATEALEPLLMWRRFIDPKTPTSSEYARPVFWKNHLLLGVSSKEGLQILDRSTGVYQAALPSPAPVLSSPVLQNNIVIYEKN